MYPLQLDIIGVQATYRTPTPGLEDRRIEALRTPAGFISVPERSPVSAGDIPQTHWISRIQNMDPVQHHLWQCGTNVRSARCTFKANPEFRFLLDPGETVLLAPGAIPAVNIPIYFSCRIHRWMRGVIDYDGDS